MTEKTDQSANLKGADELHIKDVGVFFLKDKKAYYKNGKPVEQDKLRVCQHCTSSPPFVATKEIDFARHMVEKHPKQATMKIEEAKSEKVVEETKKVTKKATKKTTKKATKKKAKKK